MAEHGSFVWFHWAEKVCWLFCQNESRAAVSWEFLFVWSWYKLLTGLRMVICSFSARVSANVEILMLKMELSRITEERDHYLRERTDLIEQHKNCRQARQSLLDIISALKVEIAGCHAILTRWHTVINAMVDRIRGRDNGSFV